MADRAEYSFMADASARAGTDTLVGHRHIPEHKVLHVEPSDPHLGELELYELEITYAAAESFPIPSELDRAIPGTAR